MSRENSMRLSQLLNGITTNLRFPPNGKEQSNFDPDVTGLQINSQKVEKGEAFIALKGTKLDGRSYISDAIEKGAIAVLVETPQAELTKSNNDFENKVLVVPIPELRQQLGKIAGNFYGHPSSSLNMIGVTGTNGKTSTTHFIAEMLTHQKLLTGVIGTLGTGFVGKLKETGLTTPDTIQLHKQLAYFVDSEAKAVAMEVSSHSIHQQRIAGVPFEVGIFTNLTQDHLDYHGNMKNYAEVKYSFLKDPAVKQVVINAEDDYGLAWIKELAKTKPVYAYATKYLAVNAPLIYVDEVKLSLNGITALLHSPWGEGRISLPVIGRFNLSNALAAFVTLMLNKVPFEEALYSLSLLKPVPGRMQLLSQPESPLVVIDYSHTPDALKKALESLRAHTTGKLWCVFGCGGDRDHGKRSKMGHIAEMFADHIIVTNDNPRHESPQTIVEDICKGFDTKHKIQIELDRSKAIEKSIQCASQTDCILIAGKGAETYQQIGDIKHPFNDAEIVQQILQETYCSTLNAKHD